MTQVIGTGNTLIAISTHTPLAGRDGIQLLFHLGHSVFLLTRPLRDVTTVIQKTDDLELISTHTPLAGRDCKTEE